jgi:hypothetical protein
MLRSIGLLLGGFLLGVLATYLYLNFSQTKREPFGLISAHQRQADSLSGKLEPGPARRITWDNCVNVLHQNYLQMQPIRFVYYDPTDPTNGTIRDQILEGLSVDRKAIDSIMNDSTQLPDRLFIMFGVRIDTIAQKPFPKTQQLFTTMLVGLKDSTKPGTYTYLTNNVFDYSNPCPPFCPTDPTKPPTARVSPKSN